MKFPDRLRVTTTVTDTSVLTLGGPTSKSFWTLAKIIAAGGAAVGDTVSLLVDDEAGNWEISTYTITNSVTLTRTAITASSNGGAAVAFAPGAKTVAATSAPSDGVSVGGGNTGNNGNSSATSTIVAPSGDTAGAADLAAINAALATTSRAVLQPGGQYYVNGPIILGSNNHLSAYGAKITLVTGVTGNILRNKAVMPSRTITDATVINPGQSNNATFTTATGNLGTAATGMVGDMVGIFGAAGPAQSGGATPGAWYGKIVATITATAGTTWANAKAATPTIIAGAVVRPATSNGFIFQATTGGAPGATEPAWVATAGQTTTDGAVVWTCLAAGTTAATLEQPALTAVTGVTANVYFASDRNDNITIQGGNWTCVDAFLSGHTATATFQNSFASAFRRVSNLRILGTTWSTNAGANPQNPTLVATGGNLQGLGGKFTISVADFQNITIDGTTFNVTAGDGVHLTGPGDSALVTNVKSFSCGDDLVVTNTEDSNTPYIMDTEGGLSNITVRDVFTKAGKSRAFCHYQTGGFQRFSGTPVRWVTKNLHVEKISGDTLGPLVGVFQAVQGLTIRNVFGATNTMNGAVAAQNPLVTVAADTGPWTGMTIEDITWLGSNIAQFGIVRIADPRGVVNVKNLRFGTATNGASTDVANIGLFVNGNMTGVGYGPTAITFDGFATNGPANGSTAYADKAVVAGGFQSSPQVATALYFGVCSGTTGIGINVHLRNIVNTAVAGYLVNKSSSFNLSSLSISDSVLTSTATTGTAAVLMPPTSGDSGCTIAFNNVRTFAPLVLAQSSVSVELVNSFFNTAGALIQMTGANAGAVCDIRQMHARQYGAGALVSRDSTQSIRIRGTDIPVDQTLLTPGDGDMIYNNNATPGNGVGVAIYNTAAAKWKNLYSGLTN